VAPPELAEWLRRVSRGDHRVVSGADPSARELDRRNWPPSGGNEEAGTPEAGDLRLAKRFGAQTNGVRRRPRRRAPAK